MARPTAQRLARLAALPFAIAAAAALLVCGAYARGHWLPWALLVAGGIGALARFGLRLRSREKTRAHESAEAALLCALGTLALTQLTGGPQSPLFPLVYLVGAGYVLAFPLALSLPLLGALAGLDAGLFFAARLLPSHWPVLAAHLSFIALFASLYHALLGARLAAARRAEDRAVRRRVEEAHERARELRLVTTADAATDPAACELLAPDARHLLAGVAEVEDVLRGALAIAEAALKPETLAVFLLAPDGESARLREGHGNGLFRGPLPAREGALGAVLSAQRPVRLESGGESLSYYEGRPPARAFCGVPLVERDGTLLGALVADRAQPFGGDDEAVLAALSEEVTRAIEAERLLGAVRREKEEKQRFFRALEALNRVTTTAQAAQVAVEEAMRLCPQLHLCAVTLADETGARRRHRVVAAAGDGSGALRGLAFADNAGLVASVVKLGAPLPGRDMSAMDRVVIFDNGTVVRGLAALKIFPLRAGEQLVGTLVCGSRDRHALNEGAQHSLALLALQAAEGVVRTQLFEQAERLATTDGLTGLFNRRTFDAQLASRLREAHRYGRPLSLLLLDVDHFKKVNDVHGHPAGDAVLKGVAALARKSARDTDVVARYGGEEMALILPETDARGALAIAERIRASVQGASHPTESGALKVTLSVGVATFPQLGETAEALLEAADKALYRAKQGGRNRVECARGKAAA